MNTKVTITLVSILCILILQSCMMLSPVKRRPLSIDTFNRQIPTQSKKVLVYLESVIPGKSIDETVWDNVQGAQWNPNESRQIGYTQDYGFVQAGYTGTAVVSGTRIVIPFGRIFSTMIGAALHKTFDSSQICLTSDCVDKHINQVDYVINIRIKQFTVKEHPMNHINFHLQITSEIQNKVSGETSKVNSVFSLDQYKIGSIASTSYGFIESMNKGTNEFTMDTVQQLIENKLIKNL